MKHSIWLLLLCLTSCLRLDINPLQDHDTYEKFSESDYNFIPTKYKTTGASNVFKSENGDSVTLQNFSYQQTEEVVTPTLFSSIHYDNVYTVLKWQNLSDCNSIEISISKGSQNDLGYNLIFWSSKNGYCGGINESFNSNGNFQQMTISSKIYKYVTKMDFGNDLFIKTSNGKTINAAYYDLENGLIGFENTQTNIKYWLQ